MKLNNAGKALTETLIIGVLISLVVIMLTFSYTGTIVNHLGLDNTDKKRQKTVKTVNVRSRGKTISRSVGKLKKKTKYTVRVRAYNNDIGVKIYGKWSKAKRFRTK